MKRRAKALLPAALVVGVLAATPAVQAAPPEGSPAYKSCGSTPTGRDHFTQETLQTANCESSGTGNETTGEVTNNGGNAPPGQNK
jgi:hypothetical protein